MLTNKPRIMYTDFHLPEFATYIEYPGYLEGPRYTERPVGNRP